MEGSLVKKIQENSGNWMNSTFFFSFFFGSPIKYDQVKFFHH
jgi:hypothetical protein